MSQMTELKVTPFFLLAVGGNPAWTQYIANRSNLAFSDRRLGERERGYPLPATPDAHKSQKTFIKTAVSLRV